MISSNVGGYKGEIIFYKNIEYNFIEVIINPSNDYLDDVNRIFLASTFVDVKFNDTREDEIEALENQIKQEKIEHQLSLDILSGKIQSLRAIEHE